MTARARGSSAPGLALAALGVVFGDIGTSPLYTLSTCFATAHAAPTLENVLGIDSLLLWLLVFVVCFKYVGMLMRVDHEGEGGILALLALAIPPKTKASPWKVGWLTLVVIAGAAMLFGDGIITPAISVLSALEGTSVATPAAQRFIVPVAIGILLGLFAIQARGTERVGRLFGPVMALWFVAIGVAGCAGILRAPQILWAADPRHAIAFVTQHGIFGFLIFGAVVLAMTGVEALYADMSHFGRGPITLAWYALVFPALLLSYLGQGAVVVADRATAGNPFFALAPGAALIPMVVLATLATVIASQALISGAFTLTEQAINLNLWPRMTVTHTSSSQQGQVYVPAVNAALAVACVALVLAFKSSAHLAAAYGLAVSATMLATSLAFFVVIVEVRGWSRRVAVPLVASFVIVDATFFCAGLGKIVEGAWVPLVTSALLLVTAVTWLKGRRRVAKALLDHQIPLEAYRHESRRSRGPDCGTMIFLTGDQRGVPFVGGTHQWVRARADEARLVLLTIVRAPRPYERASRRVSVEHVSSRLWRVTAAFGYMERPRIDAILEAAAAKGLEFDRTEMSFFYANPRARRAKEHPMPDWQRRFFQFLSRNARPLPEDLGIEPDRLVALGVEVGI